MVEFDFPCGEDDESGDAAAEGGAGAAGGVDGAAAEAGHDRHGADEGPHEVARAQREHLLAGVDALRGRCGRDGKAFEYFRHSPRRF